MDFIIYSVILIEDGQLSKETQSKRENFYTAREDDNLGYSYEYPIQTAKASAIEQATRSLIISG